MIDWTRRIPAASRGGGFISDGSILDLSTVNDGCMLVWVVVRFGGEGVVKFDAEICNVIFH